MHLLIFSESLNVFSLIAEMDMIRLWALSTDADININVPICFNVFRGCYNIK